MQRKRGSSRWRIFSFNVVLMLILSVMEDILFAQHRDGPVPIEEAAKYIDPEKGVDTAEAALAGASDILAERISDDAAVRKSLRAFMKSNGLIESRAATEDDSVYSQYYEFSQRIGKMQGHQTLAINRGEKEKLLKVSVVLDKDAALVVLREAVPLPMAMFTTLCLRIRRDSVRIASSFLVSLKVGYTTAVSSTLPVASTTATLQPMR